MVDLWEALPVALWIKDFMLQTWEALPPSPSYFLCYFNTSYWRCWAEAIPIRQLTQCQWWEYLCLLNKLHIMNQRVIQSSWRRPTVARRWTSCADRFSSFVILHQIKHCNQLGKKITTCEICKLSWELLPFLISCPGLGCSPDGLHDWMSEAAWNNIYHNHCSYRNAVLHEHYYIIYQIQVSHSFWR